MTPDLTEFNDGELRFMLATAFGELDSLREQVRREQLYNQERSDVIDERDELRAKLAELEKRYPKSFAEAHPANPNATCKCEHWQSCPDCHPTAHADESTPVYNANCIRHPEAPHGVDVDASWRAGHSVCVCQSWAPGEAS